MPASHRRIGFTFAVAAVVLALLGIALFSVARASGALRLLAPRVPPGHAGILLCLSGRAPEQPAPIAPRAAPGEEPYTGVQEDVLPPGTYPLRYPPWKWRIEVVPQIEVPTGHCAVLTRRFGADLPQGQVFADENPEDERSGIVRKGVLVRTLGPGAHLLNTRAYDVVVVPSYLIQAGQIGVVVRRAGRQPADPDALLAAAGERGAQREVLPPGIHTVHPWLSEVLPVSRQSQRLDLTTSGRGVRFATADGFGIGLNGSIEWSLPEDRVAEVSMKFGGMGDVQQKLLLPAARAVAQVLGAEKPAREFIAGLVSFQADFERDLQELVEREGPRVAAALVSNFVPPAEIAAPIVEREKQANLREQYLKQTAAERTRAELVVQVEEQERPKKLAGAVGDAIQRRAKAEADLAQLSIEAISEREKAALELELAGMHAAHLRAGIDDRVAVAAAKSAAEAALLGERVQAHGSGAAYARAVLLEKLAPRLTSISAAPSDPLGALFGALLQPPAASAPAAEDGR